MILLYEIKSDVEAMFPALNEALSESCVAGLHWDQRRKSIQVKTWEWELWSYIVNNKVISYRFAPRLTFEFTGRYLQRFHTMETIKSTSKKTANTVPRQIPVMKLNIKTQWYIHWNIDPSIKVDELYLMLPSLLWHFGCVPNQLRSYFKQRAGASSESHVATFGTE